MDKRALFGLHDGQLGKVFSICARNFGYEVDIVKTQGEMVRLVGIHKYDRYLMDINLGRPGEVYIIPASEILNLIREDIDKGLAKFLAISGNPNTVLEASRHGIPCVDTGRLELIKFLN